MVGRGFFISVEGGEKAGKSTQAVLLRDWLTSKGRSVVLTREPGGTPAGEQIRRILLNKGETALTPAGEVLLFAASRSQLVTEVIRPAMRAGKIVVADRYVDSSLAYQAYGLGLEWDRVLAVNQWATGSLWPDLTILLDVADPALLKQRPREGVGDRIENRDIEFHRRVAEGFRRIADGSLPTAGDPSRRLHIIDASLPLPEVSRAIREIVDARLAGREVPGQ